MLARLDSIGELENTIVVVSGDNGMPFPRCKATLYDSGTRVPLAVCWGSRVKGNRKVADFVSLCDFAPTFLEAAGLKPGNDMTGRSLMPLLTSDKGRARSCTTSSMPSRGTSITRQKRPKIRFLARCIQISAQSACRAAARGSMSKPILPRSMRRTKNMAAIGSFLNGSANNSAQARQAVLSGLRHLSAARALVRAA